MSYPSNCCLLSEQERNVTSRKMKFFTGKREFLSTARGGSCDGTTYTSHNASARCVVGRRTRMDARLFAAGCGLDARLFAAGCELDARLACALFARARLVDF